jgi:hypothetical protein
VALVSLAALASASWAAPNQFVILSDIHPNRDPRGGGRIAQMASLTQQLLQLRPAFVVQLGDFCGDPGPEPDLSRLEHGVQIFHRLREAGIDVYPVMGNHDIEGDSKIRFLCAHDPPFNPELDPTLNRLVYDRWCRDHRYWYSFDRGGIHFVIVDSNARVEERSRGPGESRWDAVQSFLARDLCQVQDSGDRLPTLVFVHNPHYMIGKSKHYETRPLYRVLTKCPDHTVAAVFGGDWHRYQYFAPEENLGVHTYATPPSIHEPVNHPEYIVATVNPDRITFSTVDSIAGGPGTSGAVYHPIPGRFTSLY